MCLNNEIESKKMYAVAHDDCLSALAADATV